MSKLSALSPRRAARAVANRGVRGAVLHGIRRFGMSRGRAAVGPSMIRINPMGYVCNHTCPMCWLQHLPDGKLEQEKKREREEGMKLAEYERMFDTVPAGLEIVELVGGGEPLVHPDAVEIMRSIKRRGWRGRLITNATLMKPKVSEALVEMRWDEVRASVHGTDRETYEAIQGVDRFEVLSRNLKTFNELRRELPREHRPRLLIYNVIQPENFDRVEEMFTFGEEMGADLLIFEKIIPYSDGRKLTAAEVNHAREALERGRQQHKIPTNAAHIIPTMVHEAESLESGERFVPGKSCTVGYDQAFVTAFGEVMPCCYSTEEMGQVRDTDFSEIWFGEKYAKFRERLVKGRFAKYCIENRCSLADVLRH